MSQWIISYYFWCVLYTLIQFKYISFVRIFYEYCRSRTNFLFVHERRRWSVADTMVGSVMKSSHQEYVWYASFLRERIKYHIEYLTSLYAWIFLSRWNILEIRFIEINFCISESFFWTAYIFKKFAETYIWWYYIYKYKCFQL